MTTREAIKYLKRVVDFAALNGGSEAFQVALDALTEKETREKKIPSGAFQNDAAVAG